MPLFVFPIQHCFKAVQEFGFIFSQQKLFRAEILVSINNMRSALLTVLVVAILVAATTADEHFSWSEFCEDTDVPSWTPSATPLTPTQLAANSALKHSFDKRVKYGVCQSLANLYRGTAIMATDVQVHGPNEVVNGVSVECRELLMWEAMKVEFYGFDHGFNNPCPFAPYGAAIVDRTDTSASNIHDSAGNNCGKILETNTGYRETFIRGAFWHSEINAIARLANCSIHTEYCDNNDVFLPSMNKTFYGILDLYTTVASCIEDWAAEELSGFNTIVQGPSLADIIQAGWTQDSIFEPELNIFLARQPAHVKHLIKDVLRDRILPYLTWQFSTGAAATTCPTGCHSAATNFCTKNL